MLWNQEEIVDRHNVQGSLFVPVGTDSSHIFKRFTYSPYNKAYVFVPQQMKKSFIGAQRTLPLHFCLIWVA